VNNTLTIPLNQRICLYTDEGLAFLHSLLKHSSAEAIFLHQQISLNDCDPLWFDSLHKNILWDSLAERIWQVKSLLNQLSCGTVPLVFIGTQDCIGSWWELASACHYQLWFSPEAMLGFRKNEQLAFPHYSAEPNRQKLLNAYLVWETEHVVSAAQAFSQHLISCLGFGDKPLVETQKWLAQKQHEGKAFPLQYDHYQFPELLHPFAECQKLYPKLLAPSALINPDLLGEIVWQLLKIPRSNEQIAVLNSAVVYALARYYLSDTYHRALFHRSTLSLNPSNALPYGNLITIDISEGLPPFSIIKALLLAEFELLFTAEESFHCLQQLELLQQKLRSIFGADTLAKLWGQSLHWFPRSNQQISYFSLQWGPRACVTLRRGEELRHSFTALGGKHLGAERSWWEASPGTAIDFSAFAEFKCFPKLLSTITDGILISKKSDLVLSYSSWLRLHFLGEMMQFSRRWGDGLEKTLQSLKAAGWSNVGEGEWWKSFLHDTTIEAQGQHAQASSMVLPPAEVLNYISWKKTCRAAEPVYPQAPAIAHPHAESLHMGYFSSLLAFYLHRHGCFSSLEQADLCTSAALGLPPLYKSCRFFLNKWGKKRCHYYWQKNWPSLV
jgi:hypothetical protein